MLIRKKIRSTKTLLLLGSLILCLQGGSLFSQLGTAPSTGSSSTGGDADAPTPAADANASSTASLNPRTSLTAAQIDAVLQQKPELIVELKSLVADQLQQQGLKIQADSITDEMLLSLISTNADLRANITVWLRARGYISSTDLQRSLAGTDGAVEDDSASASTFDNLTQLPSQSSGSESQLSALAMQRATADSGGSLPGTSGASTPETNMPPVTGLSNKPGSRPRNITDVPETLHLPAPYNLLALRDLYTQVPADSTKLKRFGSEVFLNRDASARGGLARAACPLIYRLARTMCSGRGDGLTVNLWGGLSQSFTKVIDREGKIILPEAGALTLAGSTLEQAQKNIVAALKDQYHDAQVSVTIARLRTVRVYVVGDVQRPGAYDLSSLSTPLNAMYEAGGPTSVGSLRVVRPLSRKATHTRSRPLRLYAARHARR